jgi:hypothetical protein
MLRLIFIHLPNEFYLTNGFKKVLKIEIRIKIKLKNVTIYMSSFVKYI